MRERKVVNYAEDSVSGASVNSVDMRNFAMINSIGDIRKHFGFGPREFVNAKVLRENDKPSTRHFQLMDACIKHIASVLAPGGREEELCEAYFAYKAGKREAKREDKVILTIKSLFENPRLDKDIKKTLRVVSSASQEGRNVLNQCQILTQKGHEITGRDRRLTELLENGRFKAITRKRIDDEVVLKAVDFTTSSYCVNHFTWSKKRVKSNGIDTLIPALSRKMKRSEMYRLYCEYIPLKSKRVGKMMFYEIATALTSKEEKSRGSIDSFYNKFVLESVGRIKRMIKIQYMLRKMNREEEKEILGELSAAKTYLMYTYPGHIGFDSTCPCHNPFFAIGAQGEKEEQEVQCTACHTLLTWFSYLAEKFDGAYDKEINDICHEWMLQMAHLMRAWIQADRIHDLERWITETRAFLSIDWKQKILPQWFRATQSRHFGLRGMSYHSGLVRVLGPDQVEERFFIDSVIEDDSKQDSCLTISVIESIVFVMKKKIPNITHLSVQSDNAGNYSSALFLVYLYEVCKKYGIVLDCFVYPEPQCGKGLVDQHFSVVGRTIASYVDDKKKDVTTPRKIVESVCGTLENTAVILLKVERKKLEKMQARVEPILKHLRKIMPKRQVCEVRFVQDKNEEDTIHVSSILPNTWREGMPKKLQKHFEEKVFKLRREELERVMESYEGEDKDEVKGAPVDYPVEIYGQICDMYHGVVQGEERTWNDDPIRQRLQQRMMIMQESISKGLGISERTSKGRSAMVSDYVRPEFIPLDDFEEHTLEVSQQSCCYNLGKSKVGERNTCTSTLVGNPEEEEEEEEEKEEEQEDVRKDVLSRAIRYFVSDVVKNLPVQDAKHVNLRGRRKFPRMKFKRGWAAQRPFGQGLGKKYLTDEYKHLINKITKDGELRLSAEDIVQSVCVYPGYEQRVDLPYETEVHAYLSILHQREVAKENKKRKLDDEGSKGRKQAVR